MRITSFHAIVKVDGNDVCFDLTERSDDWHCCISGDTKQWGRGKTVQSAMADCIRTHLMPSLPAEEQLKSSAPEKDLKWFRSGKDVAE